jgi:nicotinamide phosphoribosyltransferase
MHCFGYRGCGSEESAAIAGAAHLLSFLGTDTTAAVKMLRDYYHGASCRRPIGQSIPASEHSVMCAWSKDNNDLPAIQNMLDIYPTGNESIVSDSYDLFKTIVEYYCGCLKEQIMNRDGRVVIRPDSGDPPNIICGDPSGQNLWEQMGVLRLFEQGYGSEENIMGFREINPHIGTIYGDAIFYDRAQLILSRMLGMGFASNQILFGSGGLLLNNWSRDTLRMAIKATYCRVGNESRPIEKRPATDPDKQSKKGFLQLERIDTELGINYRTRTEVSEIEEQSGELETAYEDSSLCRDQTLDEVRDILECEETLATLMV